MPSLDAGTTRIGEFLLSELEESHSYEALSGDSGRFGLHGGDAEDNGKR